MDQDIDFSRPELFSQYGLSVQTKLSHFSGKILERIKNKDTSQVGELLKELLETIKGIDLDSLTTPGVFRRLFRKRSYELINDQMNFLIYRLEEERYDLIQDLKSLETMYEESYTIYLELEALIEKAEKALLMRELELNNVESFVGDLPMVHKVEGQRKDLKEFEARIHDLKLTQMITLQTLPQIKLIQQNNNELINKIQASILNTIPVWRMQIIQTLHFENVKEASALQKTNTDLISVIKNVHQIYQEGQVQRKEIIFP